MFLAAFTSRSWVAPHEEHLHSLIPRLASPFGQSCGTYPHAEQVRVVNFSLTSKYVAPCLLALYRSCFLMVDQPASKTDLASFFLDLMTDDGLTFPATINPFFRVSFVVRRSRSYVRTGSRWTETCS